MSTSCERCGGSRVIADIEGSAIECPLCNGDRGSGAGTKIKVRVAATQYYEIELDTADYDDPDRGYQVDLAEVVRDYEMWPQHPVDGDIGSILVLRPGHDPKHEWWEEINDDTVGRIMHGKTDTWYVFGDGTEEHRFESEDAAIRALGVVAVDV